MDSDPYMNQRHQGGSIGVGPGGQQQQQSTLNSLLSTPSSFAPSMNQMYPGHPMQQQQPQQQGGFDMGSGGGGGGYAEMQYGAQPMHGMHQQQQQQQHRGFGQMTGPPVNRMGPSGMPMMQEKGQADWMAFQQQQQQQQPHQMNPQQPGGPYSHMMQQQQQQQAPPGSMMGVGPPFPGGGPPDMNQVEDDPPPKSKSKKKKKNPTPPAAAAAASPSATTLPSARSFAHQIQQQVLQQQMVPPSEPEPPKKPSKKKKKKTEPIPPPLPDYSWKSFLQVPGPSSSLPLGLDRSMEQAERGFPPPSFYPAQQGQQQQMQYPPQQQMQQPRPPFPHGPSQYAPQPQHGGQPGWPDRGPMPSWMQQQQQPPQPQQSLGMGMSGMGMPPALSQGMPQAGGQSQMEMGQPHGIMTEPVSHTPSPSHSSSSSQNVYNQNREFPFATDVPATPPVKPKKSPTKSHKAGAAAAERAAREAAGEDPADWPTPAPAAASGSHTTKTAIEKLSALYEMGPEPDRRMVIDGIIKCCEDASVPMLNIPVIAKTSLDLYKFYHIVRSRGGYIEVHRTKGWKEIAGVMGIVSPNPNTAYTLKKQYIKFVLPYEARFDRGGQTAESIVDQADATPSAKSPGRSHRPSGGGGGSGDKKRSRTSVSAVEQLSNSADGSDGMGMMSPQQQQYQQPGLPPQNLNYSGGQGMQRYMDGQQQQQYPPQPGGYPPQPTPPPGYGNPSNSMLPEMGGGGQYWSPAGQGQMGGGPPPPQPPQSIPFEGRGLQNELFPPDSGRGDDSMQQRGGPPMHAGGGRPGMGGYGGQHGGTERQSGGPSDAQGGLNGLRGSDPSLSLDPGQGGFMTAPPPMQMSQQPPPFPERHSAMPGAPNMHGQNQMAGMSNGLSRVHPGKDGRPMLGPGQTAVDQQHHRHHRTVGGNPMQMHPNQSMIHPVETYNFPPGCVEATEVIPRCRPRMTARDAQGPIPVDVWKLHMRMRSGLMAESGWAFEMLNIYTCDDQLCGQFNLANLPAGFLETAIDWFQVAMHRLTDAKKAPEAALTANAVVEEDDNSRTADIVDDWDTAFLENAHLRTNLDYPPWGACEGRERLQECLPTAGGGVENGPSVVDGAEPNPALPVVDQQLSASANPFFLNLTTETEEDIGRKCVAISTSLRNLSAIHGNEAVMAKNQRLLSLIGRFIVFSHVHLTEEVFGAKPALAESDKPGMDVDANAATGAEVVTADAVGLDDSGVAALVTTASVPVPWWQDVMEHVRENLLVLLANVAGYMDLAECHETVCRPILEGLIHWCTCPSSMAQDVLPTALVQHPQSGELSAKCLAMEAISKLSVTDANVDLLIAAPSTTQLSHFIHELIQLLPATSSYSPTAHLLREFAMVVLCSLVTCEERVCHIVAEHPFGLEYLTMLLEEFDRMAQHGLKFDGHDGPMPTPSSAFSAMVLRKTTEILLAMAELPGVRTVLAKYQLRLWNLIISYHFPDATISALTKVLLLLSAGDSTTASA